MLYYGTASRVTTSDLRVRLVRSSINTHFEVRYHIWILNIKSEITKTLALDYLVFIYGSH